jgi:AbrB-like transcriptional regulator
MATTTKKKAEVSPLKGEALLNRVKELDNLTKEDKAKECGYYTVMPDGSERLNMMKFLNALIDAEGIELDGRASNLLIGAAYTKKMELNPGDEFEIALGRRHIHLKQVSSEAELQEAS